MGFQLRLVERGYGRLRASVAASMLCAAAMLVAGLLSSFPARAQSYTWGGATSGDYSDPTNWSPNIGLYPFYPT
ncbi:MAG TPA: hypothetical protein VHV26_15300, partial [Rhizomicrobium sp.]|nr:hypothetical protein [Rhizomicrobium sp.]